MYFQPPYPAYDPVDSNGYADLAFYCSLTDTRLFQFLVRLAPIATADNSLNEQMMQIHHREQTLARHPSWGRRLSI